MGLAFWTHLMTVPFILTAGVGLIVRYRLKVMKYLNTALFFSIGAFPFILFEAFAGFGGVGQSFSGEKMVLSADRFQWFFKEAGKLITSRPSFRIVLLFLCVLVGIALLVRESWRKRSILAGNLYAIYLAFFLITYFSSAYSGAFRPRYLYPLYFVLPVLALAPFGWIKLRLAKILALALAASLFLTPDGWRLYAADVKNAARRDGQLETLAEAMTQTRQRYWQADYWDAYLLTAISGERLIVCPLTVKRYKPYELEYNNTAHPTNYLFNLDTPEKAFSAGTLRKTLGRLNVAFKGRRLFERYVLTYDIPAWIPSHVLIRPFPERPPEMIPLRIVRSPDHLALECRVLNPPALTGFSARLNVPGTCSVLNVLLPGQETAVLDIPVPPRGPAKASLFTDFVGIPLGGTARVLDLEQIPFVSSAKLLDVVPVSGLTSPLLIHDRNGRLCSREAEFQIPAGTGAPSGIRLGLFSPFTFRDAFWYGRYEQVVEVFVAGRSQGRFRLEDGENDILIPFKDVSSSNGRIPLRLMFRYQMVFDYESLGFLKASALLLDAEAVH